MEHRQMVFAVIEKIIPILDENEIDYIIEEDAALYLQGVDIDVKSLTISIQWDAFSQLNELFAEYETEVNQQHPLYLVFHISQLPVEIDLIAYHNEGLQADKHRIKAIAENKSLWLKHYDYYYLSYKPDSRKEAIKHMLQKRQESHTQVNNLAWNQEAYDAWVIRFGEPEEAAKKIKNNPSLKLPKLLPYLGDLNNKKIMNLMGSHGTKAIAMALLGAEATIVDLSKENARYAEDVAQCADVSINYIVSDVLAIHQRVEPASYDLLFMELGVMHYFVDLKPLAKLIYGMLKDKGQFILHDFHPVSTKLIHSKGKKHKAEGNYFDPTFHHQNVAYSKHLDKSTPLESTVIQRYWTMGEMITAFANEGLAIHRLEEFPNMKKNDQGIPKTFLLECIKVCRANN